MMVLGGLGVSRMAVEEEEEEEEEGGAAGLGDW